MQTSPLIGFSEEKQRHQIRLLSLFLGGVDSPVELSQKI